MRTFFMTKPMQVSQWRRFASAEVATEDADALLQFVTGWSLTQIFLRGDDVLDPEQLQQLNACLARRRDGEPVAHITGSRGFWTLDLEVNEHTLIPRADTETLIEAVLARVDRDASLRILDLGTGSGAIALALASELKNASVTATDESEDALNVARRNANKHSLNNISFKRGSWFDALNHDERFDVIVSNPPYIADGDEHLHKGDLRFEPVSALSSGVDGLDDIRVIAKHAARFLRANGWLFFEHGYDQADAVQALLRDEGYQDITTLRDFGGNDRVTLASHR